MAAHTPAAIELTGGLSMVRTATPSKSCERTRSGIGAPCAAKSSCSFPSMLIHSARPYNTHRRSIMSQNSRSTPVGRFLASNVGAGDVFTREDLTPEQKQFGQIAAEFMRRDVVPNAARLY